MYYYKGYSNPGHGAMDTVTNCEDSPSIENQYSPLSIGAHSHYDGNGIIFDIHCNTVTLPLTIGSSRTSSGNGSS